MTHSRTQSIRRSMLAMAAILAALSAMSSAATANTFYFSVDVPSDLSGTDYTPWQFVRNWSGTYSIESSLPANVAITAIHRVADGSWYFAPADPVTLGGIDFEPRDIAFWDGANYLMILDGSASGIPDYARIDALLFDANSDYIVSFDVPVNLGGTEYSPSDLALYIGSWSSYWDAEAAGVPEYANLVGAAETIAGDLVVSFDVPTTLGASDYQPHELVLWDGAGFSLYDTPGGWSPSTQLLGVALVPPSGDVDTLTVEKETGTSNLILNWNSSCAIDDNDYEVYEGYMEDGFSSHEYRACTTGGSETYTITPFTGSRYYLIVPRNNVSEGSYGQRSDGSERGQGPVVCLPQQPGACSATP